MKALLPVLLGLCLSSGAAAAEQPTALFLLDAQPNVRLHSMGGVFSSLGQTDAAYNPWELGNTVNSSVSLAHWPGAVFESKYNFVSILLPYTKLGVFSLSYLNYGTGSETIEELDGSTRSIKLEDNKLIALGYGRHITQTIFAGGSIKSLSSVLAADYKASAMLLDFGLVYRTPNDKHSFGAAVVNYGSGLKYFETEEPVPTEYKLGYTRKTRPWAGQKVVWGLGYAKSRISDTYSLGAEWFPGIPFISVRAGVNRGGEETGLMAGLGFNYNAFNLDFGYDLSSDKMEEEQSPLRFALTWTLGARDPCALGEKYLARGMKNKALALWEAIRPDEPRYAEARSAIRQYADPPVLYAEARLEDADGDGLLSIGEKADILVTVGNSGRGKAAGLDCAVTPADPKAAAGALELGAYAGRLEALEPEQSASFKVPVKALEESQSGTLVFNISVKEAHGFNPAPALFTLNLKGFSPPRLALARYTFKEDGTGSSEGNGNGIIEKGERVELTGYLVNAGLTEARNVAWDAEAGEGVFISTPPDRALGTLAPGAARKIVLGFGARADYSGSAQLPLFIKFTEERPKFNSRQPLKLALGSFYKDPMEPVFPDFDTARALAAVPVLPGPVSDVQARTVISQIAATPPALEFEQQFLKYGEPGGKGVYQPGDTLKIKVAIRNTGGQTAQNVRVAVSGDKTAAALLGTQDAGDIPPGDSRVVILQARVPENIPRKESAFTITVTEGRGFNAIKAQEVRVAFQPKEIKVIKQLAGLLPVPRDFKGRRPAAAAVVVGIGGYRSFTALKYAAEDARLAGRYLSGVMGIPEENIKLAVDADATKTTILDKWADWLANKKGLETIVFYFAGHGVPDPVNPKDGDTFLAPYDGDPEVRGTLINLRDLIARLEGSAAKNVLVILDACYSGLKDARGLMAGPLFRQQKAVVLAGANSGQASFEFEKAGHGYFTYYLLLGLKGEADARPHGNADGAITGAELCAYVKTSMSEATEGRQTPVCTNEGQLEMGRYR